jgi:hypothetical protein
MQLAGELMDARDWAVVWCEWRKRRGCGAVGRRLLPATHPCAACVYPPAPISAPSRFQPPLLPLHTRMLPTRPSQNWQPALICHHTAASWHGPARLTRAFPPSPWSHSIPMRLALRVSLSVSLPLLCLVLCLDCASDWLAGHGLCTSGPPASPSPAAPPSPSSPAPSCHPPRLAHPRSQAAWVQLACVQLRQGKAADAVHALTHVRTLSRAVFGAGSDQVLSCTLAVADVHAQLSAWDAAVALLSEGLEESRGLDVQRAREVGACCYPPLSCMLLSNPQQPAPSSHRGSLHSVSVSLSQSHLD